VPLKKTICLTFNLVQFLLALITKVNGSNVYPSRARVLAGVASLWRTESESRGAKCQMRPTLFMRCGSRGDLNDANYWQFSAQLADLTRSLVNCAAVAAAAACGVLLSARRPPPI
jgi:hypothetical protein